MVCLDEADQLSHVENSCSHGEWGDWLIVNIGLLQHRGLGRIIVLDIMVKGRGEMLVVSSKDG